MPEQMSLTRVIKLIKTLKEDIRKHKFDGQLTAIQIGTSDMTVGHQTASGFSETTSSKVQSIFDKLELLGRLQSKLAEANTTTRLKVKGRLMSITEAIQKKSIIELESSILSQLRANMLSTQRAFDQKEEHFISGLNGITNNFGSKDKKITQPELDALVKDYSDRNKPIYIDPSNIGLLYTTKLKELEEFMTEVDICLSEVNGQTYVEV